ncbi:MAG: calcium/sodium antiporter [Ktedonobacteraceae bacterium]|nr:calcium/sodium antiporter [Ktedonobacteraceae bacterium]
MLLALLFVGIGLAGLYLGGEWLVKGAARLADSFGVSSRVIGLTIVAWSTSAPELVVGIDAALKGSPEISLGNVLGSNIANIGLVLSVMALCAPLVVHPQLLKREIPLMVATALLAALLALDGKLDRLDGAILLFSFLFVTWLLYRWIKRDQRILAIEAQTYAEHEELNREPPRPPSRWLEAGWTAAGLALLIEGANLTVEGAATLARTWGVSELIIGVSLVALGTSLPELVTAIVTALHKETELGIGNVVGSNIANILAILGVTALISPIRITPTVLHFDLPWMIGFSLLLLLLALDRRIQRWKAVLLLGGYIGFVVLLFFR